MPDQKKIDVSEAVFFGAFRLQTTERLLVRSGAPVEIGSRALDLLIALIARAGQVVSKTELMSLAWPDLTIGEAALRVHVTELRRALEDGRDGSRYIVNVPGRGYEFIAPIQHSLGDSGPVAARENGLARTQSLPELPESLIGRDQTVTTLCSLLQKRRFLSVVGPGGIGKTTAVVAAAHALHRDFCADEICYVDLGSLTDSQLVPAAVASAVGCIVAGADIDRSLLAFLGDKRRLIIFDSCEHVISAVAPLIERIFSAAPLIHILTTSREPLRVEGESIYLLSALDFPTDDLPTAHQALEFSAVRLFMERAVAGGYEAELGDSDAPVVSNLCRQLDGIPLALELAASRAGTYGIRGIADLLGRDPALMLRGRRSATLRHQTLGAMLDWSFRLLSEYEQRLLCSLSIFVGQFSLEAAESIVGDANDPGKAVRNAIISLVDKSLLSFSQTSGASYFRLLDTTRVHAAAKLSEVDRDVIANRHANHYATLLKAVPRGSPLDQSAFNILEPHLGNIRSALSWSFSSKGDVVLGVALAARATRVFLALSLYTECLDWCRRALHDMPQEALGTKIELDLQEAFAITFMSIHGVSEEVKRAIERGLELSEKLNDSWGRFCFLIGLNIFFFRLGNFSGAFAAAQQSAAVAGQTRVATATVVAEWTLGSSHQMLGDQVAALRHLEKGFSLESHAEPAPVHVFGFDHRMRARVGLARSLWLRGFPDQALEVATRIIRDAEEESSPISQCNALLYTVPVLLWTGRFEEAVKPIELSISKAQKYSLGFYHSLGVALKGELMVATGDATRGVEMMEGALRNLHSQRYFIMTPNILRALSEGLLRCGRREEALATIDEGLAQIDENKGIFWMPELCRVRGEILMAQSEPDLDAAERWVLRSIDYARKQFSLSWELQSSISLASLLRQRGRGREANAMLDTLYRRFQEGFRTRDLSAVRDILEARSQPNDLIKSK